MKMLIFCQFTEKSGRFMKIVLICWYLLLRNMLEMKAETCWHIAIIRYAENRYAWHHLWLGPHLDPLPKGEFHNAHWHWGNVDVGIAAMTGCHHEQSIVSCRISICGPKQTVNWGEHDSKQYLVVNPALSIWWFGSEFLTCIRHSIKTDKLKFLKACYSFEQNVRFHVFGTMQCLAARLHHANN